MELNEVKVRKHNKNGGGAKTTENGLEFERASSFRMILEKNGYLIEDYKIYKDGVEVGKMCNKHKLYTKFFTKDEVKKADISSELLPDEAVMLTDKKIAYIFENKFQTTTGSADEKIQTADFKNKTFKKLFAVCGYEVKYIYILSDWFKRDKYRDMLDYIKSVGCEYYFNEVPISRIENNA